MFRIYPRDRSYGAPSNVFCMPKHRRLDILFCFLTPGGFFLKGSVHRAAAFKEVQPKDRLLRNARNTWKRYRSRPLPQEQLHVSIGEQYWRLCSNAHGLFELFVPATEAFERQTWMQRGCTVSWRNSTGAPIDQKHVPIADLGIHAQRVIVSDVDDTLLLSHATRPLPRARLLLFRNAFKRESIPGSVAFIKSLQQGPSQSAFNPVFYLSNSEWNLYDLLLDFFYHHQYPSGPLLLRDQRVIWRDLIRNKRAFIHTHKRRWIQTLLEAYPQYGFVLVGDAGQRDPSIYWEFLHRYPHRIEAVFIRNIQSRSRNRRRDFSGVAAGKPYFLVDDYQEAMQKAHKLRLIAGSSVAEAR